MNKCIWLAMISVQAGRPLYLTAKSKWKLFFLQRGQGKIKRYKECYLQKEMITLSKHNHHREMLIKKMQTFTSIHVYLHLWSTWKWIKPRIKHIQELYHINRLLYSFNCIFTNTTNTHSLWICFIVVMLYGSGTMIVNVASSERFNSFV